MSITQPNACSRCRSTYTMPIQTKEDTHIWCLNCFAEGARCPTLEDAIAAWNSANPLEVRTEWFCEPSGADGQPRMVCRSFLADQWNPEEYEARALPIPGLAAGALTLTVYVRKSHP